MLTQHWSVPEMRQAFRDGAYRKDADVRVEVESLLPREEQAGRVLETSALPNPATSSAGAVVDRQLEPTEILSRHRQHRVSDSAGPACWRVAPLLHLNTENAVRKLSSMVKVFVAWLRAKTEITWEFLLSAKHYWQTQRHRTREIDRREMA